MKAHKATAAELKAAGIVTLAQRSRELKWAQKDYDTLCVQRPINYKSREYSNWDSKMRKASARLMDAKKAMDYYKSHKNLPIGRW